MTNNNNFIKTKKITTRKEVWIPSLNPFTPEGSPFDE